MINELELDPHFITTFPHCLRRSGAPNNRAKKPPNPSFARNLRGNFPSLHTSRSRPRNSGKWSRIYESWPHMDDATLRLCRRIVRFAYFSKREHPISPVQFYSWSKVLKLNVMDTRSRVRKRQKIRCFHRVCFFSVTVVSLDWKGWGIRGMIGRIRCKWNRGWHMLLVFFTIMFMFWVSNYRSFLNTWRG